MCELNSDEDLHADGHGVGDLLEHDNPVPRKFQPVGRQVLADMPRYHLHDMARSAQANRDLRFSTKLLNKATSTLELCHERKDRRCTLDSGITLSMNGINK